ncbi:MAG: histone deacetylase family protein [Oligoflexia bacterium]|nr:histone deacetylase family protein [Oligoflexia bacterium]
MKFPVFFHPLQKEHKPLYEWAFGKKLNHPETTKRIESILAALEASHNIFEFIVPEAISQELIHNVHDEKLTQLYLTAEEQLAKGKTFYPSVFPRSLISKKPSAKKLAHAGGFCFDSGTPLTSVTKKVAEWSVACANGAALLIENKKSPFAYSLCRPPGHHASHKSFGGYCYYNNAAIVASRWAGKSKVAIVDIDFHHGNGTQDIFYEDNRVLFISVHGHPLEFYPYFSGYEEEEGRGKGKGFTINIPLSEGIDGYEYLKIIDTLVIPALKKFDPKFLILSAGFDTYKEDPIGRFNLETDDFPEVAARFANLGLPTLILQEGGYSVEKLGVNVRSFLEGFKDNFKKIK